MPKRESQTQNSPPPTKSKRCRREQQQELPSIDPSSINPSSDLDKDMSTTSPTSPTPLAEDHVEDSSKSCSQEEPRTELSADTSKDVASKIRAREDLFKSGKFNLWELPNTNFTKWMNPAVDPFESMLHSLARDKVPLGISITAENFEGFKNLQLIDFINFTYPEDLDMYRVTQYFAAEILSFAANMTHRLERSLNDEEIDRIRHAFAEFGQHDHDLLSPSLLAERLVNPNFRYMAVQYIIYRAILPNISVDGAIEHTLLPPHVLAMYRDLDRHSSSAHRTLGCRWLELTFGLLEGHNAWQASAELRQRTARIRQFLTDLLEPYCVQRGGYGVFSETIDKVLQWAVAVGYHLFGWGKEYRWDWTWLESQATELGREIVGQPPSRPPPEEEVPKNIWITCPALVKVTNRNGEQLAIPITYIEAHQSMLYEVEKTPAEMAAMKASEEAYRLDWNRRAGDRYPHLTETGELVRVKPRNNDGGKSPD